MIFYNPKLHNRKALRLKGYDYSRVGYYFITICCQDRTYRFGHVENGIMILNDAGKMVEKWYYELENKYPDKRCHEMIVMPNHMHCIIENVSSNTNDKHDAHETAQPKPDAHEIAQPKRDAHEGTSLRGRPVDNNCHVIDGNGIVANIDDDLPNTSKYGMHNKIYGATICDAMDWFKTMTTNEYIRGVKQFGWPRYNKKLWQRSYRDSINRTDYSLQKRKEYIINNPANWNKDKLSK